MRRRVVSRRGLLSTFGAGVLLAAAPAVRAQSSLDRLRILCISPPGGTPDWIARTYARALDRKFPAGVVVDNRPGAAGRVAIAALRQSAPDGATMLLAHSGVVTLFPYLYARLGYDPDADLAPVSLAAEITFGFAVGPAVPAEIRRLDAFVAWARANPTACTYASPGAGTLPHLIGALLFKQERIDAQHVAYSGGPNAIADALGGRLAALVFPESLLRPHLGDGKLRVLATSTQGRSPYLPAVPSFAEQGRTDLVAREWMGFFMPHGTALALRERMSESIQSIAASAPLAAVFDDLALRVLAATPAAMAERIAAERRLWRETIAALGLKIEE